MTVFCTYCSAEKDSSSELLPALLRYKSKRISSVSQSANNLELDFVILSGKFGLVSPDEKIAYYDHLLVETEVAEHANIIASQLKMRNITELVFFTGSVEEDKNLKAYIDCITLASSINGTEIQVVVIPAND